VLAAVSVAAQDGEPHSAGDRKRIANAAVKQVATYLSNTPAVCRASYIDPRVFDRFDSGETIARSLRAAGGGSNPSGFPDRERIERAVLRLLR
jgi:DNA topoisomerase IB